MDGDGIRALSAAQRRLIDELVRAGITAGGLTNPTTTLREDVTGTLQAAIADPDVLARLGHLAKAERWSGFGEFGDITAASTATKASRAPAPVVDDTRGREKARAREEREKARAALAEAERAKAAADDEMSDRQSQLTAARRHHDEARAALRAAERELQAAKESAEDAERKSHDAAGLVSEAKKQLKATR